MALTPEETTKYTAYLTEAETAYHRLQMGGAVRVFVDQNGERIEYSAVNRLNLLSYINELRALLGMDPYPFAVVGRPAGVIF